MLKIHEFQQLNVFELADRSGLSESTVRYYLRDVLGDYLADRFPDLKTRKGRVSLYPTEVLDRLRFIRIAKEQLETSTGNQRSPTLAELKLWMNTITDEQVHAVLSGDDTVEFGIARIKDGVRYIERVNPKATTGSREPGPRSRIESSAAPGHVIAIAPGVEIRHTRPLTKRQSRLLAPIKDLLNRIFEEG